MDFHSKRKLAISSISAIFVFALLGFIVFKGISLLPQRVSNEVSRNTPISKAESKNTDLSLRPAAKATLKVGAKMYEANITPGVTTAYNLMTLARDTSDLKFKEKEFPGLGVMIEEINGQKNDNQNQMYWVYYVNGQSATEGISTYILKDGDMIEWRFEKIKI